MKPEMKPCPCCGKSVKLIWFLGVDLYGIECADCRLIMRDADDKKLVKKWNRRRDE